MGSAALAVLAHFMVAQPDVETDEDRQIFAQTWRDGYAFLYENVSDDEETPHTGAYQSDLIIQTVAQHMAMTTNAANIPALNTKALQARGAISFAAVVVTMF